MLSHIRNGLTRDIAELDRPAGRAEFWSIALGFVVYFVASVVVLANVATRNDQGMFDWPFDYLWLGLHLICYLWFFIALGTAAVRRGRDLGFHKYLTGGLILVSLVVPILILLWPFGLMVLALPSAPSPAPQAVPAVPVGD